MNPSDTLLAARDLIADTKNWRQHRLHNDTHTKHCAWGAVDHVTINCDLATYSPEENVLRYKTLEYLNEAATPYDIIIVNDNFGHKAVMEIYDRAIRLAKDAGE